MPRPAKAPLLTLLAAMLWTTTIVVATAGTPSPPWPSIAWRSGPILPDGPHPDRQIETLSRKIGQMLMIGFPGTRPQDPGPTKVAAMIAAGEIGGVILFADNVRSPKQLAALTAALEAAGGSAPPFIAVDQEGGSIQRLNRRKGFLPLASAKTMARKTPCEAYGLYLKTAEELAAAHINVNFGPVVDLNINPANPAIGKRSRSYGREPDQVVAFAEAFVDAHRAAGVLTAAKHFPGHGSAGRDPHIAVVDISQTWEDQELLPFADLIEDDDVPMVMVGHLIHGRFSDGDRPTSLSRRAITAELRDGLGFNGLVVTDDLGMDAITRRYEPEVAAAMAVRAGADVLIFVNLWSTKPQALDRVVQAVAGDVAAGRIPARLVEESHARSRAAREALGRRTAAPTAPQARDCTDPRAARPGDGPSQG